MRDQMIMMHDYDHDAFVCHDDEAGHDDDDDDEWSKAKGGQ